MKSTPSPLYVNLEIAIRAIVRDEQAKIGRSTGTINATSYTKDDLPPELATYKSFAKLCASGAVPGAWQTATRGPWVVSRADWFAARGRRPAPRLSLVQAGPTDTELAELALRGRRAS